MNHQRSIGKQVILVGDYNIHYRAIDCFFMWRLLDLENMLSQKAIKSIRYLVDEVNEMDEIRLNVMKEDHNQGGSGTGSGSNNNNINNNINGKEPEKEEDQEEDAFNMKTELSKIKWSTRVLLPRFLEYVYRCGMRGRCTHQETKDKFSPDLYQEKDIGL